FYPPGTPPLARGSGQSGFFISSVIFAFRDLDLNISPIPNFAAVGGPPTALPNDQGHPFPYAEDIPAWWNMRKRSHYYWIGRVPVSHESVGPFMNAALYPSIGPKEVEELRPKFVDVLHWVDSMDSKSMLPAYPG